MNTNARLHLHHRKLGMIDLWRRSQLRSDNSTLKWHMTIRRNLRLWIAIIIPNAHPKHWSSRIGKRTQRVESNISLDLMMDRKKRIWSLNYHHHLSIIIQIRVKQSQKKARVLQVRGYWIEINQYQAQWKRKYIIHLTFPRMRIT